MKMKVAIILVSLLTPFTSLFASNLSEYEQHYEELNRLRGQLEKLELEKKIQQLKTDIKDIKAGTATAGNLNRTNQVSQAPVSLGAASSVLSSSKLIYIVGTGADLSAVIDFKGNEIAVKNGDIIDGWNVEIDSRKVKLHKGKDSIEL